jgi:hypothetical protein
MTARKLIALALALLATPALAQEIPVQWDRQGTDDLDIIRVKYDEAARDPTWGSARGSKDFDGHSDGGVIDDAALTYCTLYRMAVRSRDVAGNVSPASNAVDAWPKPVITGVSPETMPRDHDWHVITLTGNGFVEPQDHDGDGKVTGGLIIRNRQTREREGPIDPETGEPTSTSVISDIEHNQTSVDSCTQVRIQIGARRWAELRDIYFYWTNPDGQRARFEVGLTDAPPDEDDGQPPPAMEFGVRVE